MSHREQKKLATREAMIDATVGLSIRHGFDAVSVDAIAAAAGVSRRTFFRYFDSKDGAFFADHEARLARFRASLQRSYAHESAYHRVRRCLLDLAAHYEHDRALLTERYHVIEGSRHLVVQDLAFDRRFEEAIIEALTPEDADANGLTRARVVGAALFGVVRAVLRPWFDDPTGPDLVSLGETALSLLEQGVAPQSVR